MTQSIMNEKVAKRLKELKDCMRWNGHLVETLYVMDLMYSINKHSNLLNTEDKNFLNDVKLKLKEIA